MTRNLKAIGLAIFVALALCTAFAAVASAQGDFTASSYPATLTGSREIATEDELRTTAGIIKCFEFKFDGTLNAESSATTVTPNFGDCSAFGLPAVVDTNGCDYRLTIDPLSPLTHGWFDIQCPAFSDITITAGQNTLGSQTTKCTVHIPPQTVGGVSYENRFGGTISVNVRSTGFTYTHTVGTGLGKCNGGGTTEQHNGEYLANWTVSGEKTGTGIVIDVG